MEVKLYLGLENGEARKRLIASMHGAHIRSIDGLKFIDSANILGILCYLTASLEFLI